MDLHSLIGDVLGNDRLLFNLLAIHALIGTALAVSQIIKYVLAHGGDHLVHFTGLHWLDGINKEAVRRAKNILFWLTLGTMFVIVAAGGIYHANGRDVRVDVNAWYHALTLRDVLMLAVAFAELMGVVCGTWLAVRWIRRLRHMLQVQAHKWLEEHHKESKEPLVERWFFLLERYAIVVTFLVSVWLVGTVVGLGHVASHVVGFVLRMLAILGVAHLLVMACRTLSRALAAWGSRSLGAGKFHRYWDRITRLFPFGEKCFETAVYVSAASMIIRELHFVAVIADFGPRLVQCIGIFFGTRVLIELLYVLINEAFGMYDEERIPSPQPLSPGERGRGEGIIDQKGQTLVPLMQSICQYVLYFGSGVVMLGVLGVDTRPILAGAGILGLAGGLGAQSFITDVVSGFFILFESHYLVGDFIKIGDSVGRVEAVSIRCTQIRDEQGRLHIIPNGQVKNVINFSKGFVNASVDVKLPSSQDVETVFAAMTEAGRRLRHARKEVLGDTVIKGLVDLTPSDMVVRAVTRVQPGSHQAIENEYRRLLKEVFDEQTVTRKAAA